MTFPHILNEIYDKLMDFPRPGHKQTGKIIKEVYERGYHAGLKAKEVLKDRK
jgi:hypothetical protein